MIFENFTWTYSKNCPCRHNNIVVFPNIMHTTTNENQLTSMEIHVSLDWPYASNPLLLCFQAFAHLRDHSALAFLGILFCSIFFIWYYFLLVYRPIKTSNCKKETKDQDWRSSSWFCIRAETINHQVDMF